MKKKLAEEKARAEGEGVVQPLDRRQQLEAWANRTMDLVSGGSAGPGGSRQSRQRLWRAQGTVLVVEAEEAFRSIAVLALRSAGFEVLAARDGREALEVFGRDFERLDLVLLDLELTRPGGGSMLEGLLGIRPGAAVIVSGKHSSPPPDEGAAGKFAAYLAKPYGPLRLLQVVRKVLES